MLPIPKSYENRVVFVNGTPHLSANAARVHRERLEKVTDLEGFTLAAKALSGSNQLQRALSYYKSINYDWAMARDKISFAGSAARVRLKTLRERLMREVDEWQVDPTLGDKEDLQHRYEEILRWIESLEDAQLRQFERKSAMKYAGNQNVRSWAAYLNQLRNNYLPERQHYSALRLPEMHAYEKALEMQYQQFPAVPNANAFLEKYSAAMNTTQRNTFGGAPFYVSMDEFVDPDGDDNVTMVEIYDYYATIYFLLPPRYKVSLCKYYQYTALERIQHGGVEGMSVLSDHKATKQRIIQAESAVISHATKQMHDMVLERWREHLPLAADKFGEEQVTASMYKMYKEGLRLHAEYPSVRLQLTGLDWFNYDANINPVLLNDAYFNVVRLSCPKWYNYWIVDPYYSLSMQTPTFVPGAGLRVTTGVKSGQQITNQADSVVGNFVDCYELVRAEQDSPVPKQVFDKCLEQRMINGDDRLKLTWWTPEQVEQYNLELGLIAQKEKQEVYRYGTPTDQLQVTYLKTIMYKDKHGKLTRTSSLAADVLGRYTRERIRQRPMPYSLVMETIMAGNRLSEHPDITALIQFLRDIPQGEAWLSGELTTQQLLDGAAIEQLEALKLSRGNRWLRRMKMYDNTNKMLEMLYSRFGMVQGSYNYQSDYSDPETGLINFEQLPLTKRVLNQARGER